MPNRPPRRSCPGCLPQPDPLRGKCQPSSLLSAHCAPRGSAGSHVTDAPGKPGSQEAIGSETKPHVGFRDARAGLREQRQKGNSLDAPCWAASVSLCVPSSPSQVPSSLPLTPFKSAPSVSAHSLAQQSPLIWTISWQPPERAVLAPGGDGHTSTCVDPKLWTPFYIHSLSISHPSCLNLYPESTTSNPSLHGGPPLRWTIAGAASLAPCCCPCSPAGTLLLTGL